MVPLMLLAVVAGCVVYSVNPFCGKDKVVEMKELDGWWQLTESCGENVADKNITPWRINDGRITSYDTANKSSQFKTSFFKLKSSCFADMTGDSSLNNAYWNVSVIPMHILLKVELKDNTLTFVPLNVEWFQKADNEQVKMLKYVVYESNPKVRIYTASSEEWEKFLENNLDNPELFNQKHKVVLKKIQSENSGK